jgi:mannose-6-phosphate isomerase-like protein (cupin superfamily)
MSNKKVSLLDAVEKLKMETEKRFVMIMKHGSMSVEYFSPLKQDNQTPHRQDELYVINRGHGSFNRNGEKIECKAGDVLFVPAGMPHQFENFSDDFATWVIFYGPDGGEEDIA